MTEQLRLEQRLGQRGAVGSFVVCVLYGLIVPQSPHMGRALEVALPGFTWLTVPGVLIGPIHNAFTRRWGAVAP